MKIIGLEVENVKRIRAVQLRPDGNMVIISGENGEGKSSLLDAIWIGLVGKSVAPPRPVRAGCETATIKLDLGELLVTRTFTDKEGKITDTLKVTDPEGRRYPSPQKVLDELLGRIGFDPFAFTLMTPAKQAATLREMVPLSVDLDDLAALDARDTENRRDINRDAAALKAQIEGIALPPKLPDAIDKAELMDQMAKAADVNVEIERERRRRELDLSGIADVLRAADGNEQDAKSKRAEAERLRKLAQDFDDDAVRLDAVAKGKRETCEQEKIHIEALPPLADPVDTAALSTKIAEADQVAAVLQRAAQKAALVKKFNGLRARSEALSTALSERAKERADALAEAKMPIEGLGLMGEGKDQLVTYGGVPFEQVNTADQLRVSTAIAMAANPTLRVLRIKDGSSMTDKTLAILAEQVTAEDFQIFVEMARPGADVGIVIEDGMVKAKAEPEPETKPDPKPKAKKSDDKPAGSLL